MCVCVCACVRACGHFWLIYIIMTRPVCVVCVCVSRYSSVWKGNLVLYCGKYGLVERLGECVVPSRMPSFKKIVIIIVIIQNYCHNSKLLSSILNYFVIVKIFCHHSKLHCHQSKLLS